MKIEWKEDPENQRFLVILIDESPWKRIFKSLVLKDLDSLKVCKSHSELWQRWDKIEQKAAFAKIYQLLAGRSYFSSELKKKMSELGLSLKVIEEAIAECKRLGYIQDEEQTRAFIRKEMRKGCGLRLIICKLNALGVPNAKQILESFIRENDTKPILQIHTLLQKRFRAASLLDEKQKRRAILMLQRRGFDLESIFDALKNYQEKNNEVS